MSGKTLKGAAVRKLISRLQNEKKDLKEQNKTLEAKLTQAANTASKTSANILSQPVPNLTRAQPSPSLEGMLEVWGRRKTVQNEEDKGRTGLEIGTVYQEVYKVTHKHIMEATKLYIDSDELDKDINNGASFLAGFASHPDRQTDKGQIAFDKERFEATAAFIDDYKPDNPDDLQIEDKAAYIAALVDHRRFMFIDWDTDLLTKHEKELQPKKGHATALKNKLKKHFYYKTDPVRNLALNVPSLRSWLANEQKGKPVGKLISFRDKLGSLEGIKIEYVDVQPATTTAISESKTQTSSSIVLDHSTSLETTNLSDGNIYSQAELDEAVIQALGVAARSLQETSGLGLDKALAGSNMGYGDPHIAQQAMEASLNGSEEEINALRLALEESQQEAREYKTQLSDEQQRALDLQDRLGDRGKRIITILRVAQEHEDQLDVAQLENQRLNTLSVYIGSQLTAESERTSELVAASQERIIQLDAAQVEIANSAQFTSHLESKLTELEVQLEQANASGPQPVAPQAPVSARTLDPIYGRDCAIEEENKRELYQPKDKESLVLAAWKVILDTENPIDDGKDFIEALGGLPDTDIAEEVLKFLYKGCDYERKALGENVDVNPVPDHVDQFLRDLAKDQDLDSPRFMTDIIPKIQARENGFYAPMSAGGILNKVREEREGYRERLIAIEGVEKTVQEYNGKLTENPLPWRDSYNVSAPAADTETVSAELAQLYSGLSDVLAQAQRAGSISQEAYDRLNDLLPASQMVDFTDISDSNALYARACQLYDDGLQESSRLERIDKLNASLQIFEGLIADDDQHDLETNLLRTHRALVFVDSWKPEEARDTLHPLYTEVKNMSSGAISQYNQARRKLILEHDTVLER